MVYKKYIKRGGKIYGPYVYHSRRVNGKVVSEYHGSRNRKTINFGVKKFLWVFVGIAFLLSAFLLLSQGNNITGKAILGFEANYTSGEPLEGILKLSLKEGELIPSDARIIFENSGDKYGYSLQEVVSNEPLEGNFYIEGKSISGNGKGYGKIGVLKDDSEISFILNIYSLNNTNDSEEKPSEDSKNDSEIVLNETSEGKEIPEEINETESPTFNESYQEFNETNSSTTINESSGLEINESESLEIEEEEIPEEDSENESVSENSENSPITGNAFLSFFSWRGTGNVILGVSNEIEGKVSKESPFSYKLSESQTAEIKSGSVQTASGKTLSENILELEILDKSVSITTNYSDKDFGFGKKYLGDESEEIIINISNLDLRFEKGNLNVSIIYSDEEIVSVETFLKEGIEIKNYKDTNLENETNVNFIEEKPLEEIVKVFLTDEEKQVLKEEFGNAPIKNIRSESVGSEIIIGYEFSGQRVEFIYSSSEDVSRIKEMAESDKNKWLKDMAQKIISKRKESSEKVEGIVEENSEI